MAATEPRDVHQGSSWKRGRGWLNFLVAAAATFSRIDHPLSSATHPHPLPGGMIPHPGVCLDAISRTWLYSIIKDRYWIKRDSIPRAVPRLIPATRRHPLGSPNLLSLFFRSCCLRSFVRTPRR